MARDEGGWPSKNIAYLFNILYNISGSEMFIEKEKNVTKIFFNNKKKLNSLDSQRLINESLYRKAMIILGFNEEWLIEMFVRNAKIKSILY